MRVGLKSRLNKERNDTISIFNRSNNSIQFKQECIPVMLKNHCKFSS